MTYQTLQCRIAFGDTTIQMGLLPADSIVLNPYIVVITAFNDTGTDLIRVGTADDDDAFGTDKDVSSAIINPSNFTAGVALGYYAAGTKIRVKYAGQNLNATTGSAIVVVPYIRVKPS